MYATPPGLAEPRFTQEQVKKARKLMAQIKLEGEMLFLSLSSKDDMRLNVKIMDNMMKCLGYKSSEISQGKQNYWNTYLAAKEGKPKPATTV